MIWELGRIPYSPQSFTSPRKHRLRTSRLMGYLGSNICRPGVRYAGQWFGCAMYRPFRVLRPLPEPHSPPTATLAWLGFDPQYGRGPVEYLARSVVACPIRSAVCRMWPDLSNGAWCVGFCEYTSGYGEMFGVTEDSIKERLGGDMWDRT